MRILRQRMAAVLGLTMVVSLGTAGIAAALVTDNMFPTANTPNDCWNQDPGDIYNNNVPCRTDNTNTYYYMDSADAFELESPDRTAVIQTMNWDYGPTDLYIVYDSDPAFSGPAETDIVYQEGRVGNLPPNIVGVTWCDDAAGAISDECDQQVVRIRGYGTYDRGLACHETGHAVGLQHGALSSPQLSNQNSRLGCLVTDPPSGAGLGSHNSDMIDATY
ncbi:hypothetical protein HNR06_004949 [Nocardiopsis arvandica]|uniref:Peptidase M10 metallopeptidase domain-containing protein n=1 Tax=Nocardiopsis sinuspersici TaxID=501010 RepID=A0A7Y9XIS5_9ACTN|nr:hypothetical protein [Nocardiopsis sinuspersici]NYH55360.1 hypothetical protein [Nocardiopsis sinuspersici]